MDPGSMGGRVQSWVKERFAEQETVTRGQLIEASRDSDLPEETCAAIAGLAEEGPWPKGEAVHRIVDVLQTRSGGGARGNANLPGAGGYGR